MKIVKKILLGLLAIPLAFLAVAAVLQIYYRLTPVALSAEALALNARAAKLPTLTENGYRLKGLFAPREQDAVVFGKCLLDAQEQHRLNEKASGVKAPENDDKVAWTEYDKGYGERFNRLLAVCNKEGTPLTLPATLTDIRISLDTTDDQWQTLASVVVDETLQARADAVRDGGVRRLGEKVDSPFPPDDTLMKLERWRIARGVVAWRGGDRPMATNLWATAIADWAKSANSTLIEAMLATAAQTQVLIAIQSSVAQVASVDEATANGLLISVKPIETMPDSVAESMIAEWQMHGSLMKQLSENPMGGVTMGAKRNEIEAATDRMSAWTFDPNDTMNLLASNNLWSQDAMLKAALGQMAPAYPGDRLAFGCGSGGGWGMVCLPFVRNPVGRILVTIAMPAYANYGVRVADLRNFAAATRLTIEARRRQLTGDALVQFVAKAPSDMRDVFTGRPFSYDQARKRLVVELHERSTVLGDKEPYELAL